MQQIHAISANLKKPRRFFEHRRGRTRRENDSVFRESRSLEFMNNNASQMILDFRMQFGNIERKSIQQDFGKNMFSAAPQEAPESPVLFQNTECTFGLDRAV